MASKAVKVAWKETLHAMRPAGAGLAVGITMGFMSCEPTWKTYISWGCAVVAIPLVVFVAVWIIASTQEKQNG